jgi:transcriptional regulator with XRE-family HTH domain
MHLQVNNQVNELKENLFEHALKRISVQAFDALLTCGVRNLNGLLHLTSEDMRKAGLPKHIISELMSIPLQFRNDATESDRQKSELNQNVISVQSLQEEQQEPIRDTDCNLYDLVNGTPIPNELIAKLPTRARNVLNREKILTIERLLEFQEEDLFNIAGIGRKTVFDIKRLQGKVKNSLSQKSKTAVKDTLQEKPTSPDLPYFFPRVRCYPRTSEHWLSDPADWSLLSRTLPELFWVTLPSLNDSEYEENVTIGDLGISASDICKFREIVLFQEDTADLLFSISLGCLLQVSISDDTFSKLLDYLEHFTGHPSLSKKFASTAKVSSTPVFADIPADLIEKFRIPKFVYQDLFEIFGGSKSTITWGDIAKISERNVIKHFGFTLQGLKVIKHLWLLKEHALKFITRISAGLPTEAYSSFSNLVDGFVRTIIKKAYHYPVVMGRLGFLDQRRWTLEELGQRLNLTRERIRQIEKMYMPVLEKPKVLDRLNLLWYAVDESLKTGGGVCCVSEIADSLKDCWKWKALPSGEALALLISLSAKYEVVWENPIRIIMPIHGCVNCSKIGPVLTSAVESQPNGTLSFEKAIATMKEFCFEQVCETSSEITSFSNGYIHFLDDAIEEIIADEDTLYTPYAWAQKYGGRRLHLVEIILRNAGRAMHFTEVCAEINKDRPEHGKFSEHNIHAYLGRSPEILLWDRGTYIHRDHVSIPSDLIARIEDEIILRLDCDIPYLSVSGIYKVFIDDLIANNIPSESALYSCLRASSNNKLSCPDYPNIVKSDANVQRLPITLILESFVLNQEGSVSYEDLRSYAVEKLCINEAVFVGSHLQNIPNILRINRGEYIHLNQIAFEVTRFAPIIDHLTTLLKTSNHVSAIKLYNDKKISCRLMGISTPILLYSIIQFFYSEQFELPRFPKICIAGHSETGSRATGVASEVIRYISEKGTPCSFAELYQHFVDELGYKQMSVYNVHFNSRVRPRGI